MKQGKVWGETEEIFNNGLLSLNVLNIKKGGFCSEHQHSSKTNIFFVLSGRLEVYQWPGGSEGESPDITVLGPGDSTAIEPGIWHKFQAAEDTACFEYYQIRFHGDDIIRRSHGGREA